MSTESGIFAFGWRSRVAGFGACTNPFLRGSTFSRDWLVGWRTADRALSLLAQLRAMRGLPSDQEQSLTGPIDMRNRTNRNGARGALALRDVAELEIYPAAEAYLIVEGVTGPLPQQWTVYMVAKDGVLDQSSPDIRKIMRAAASLAHHKLAVLAQRRTEAGPDGITGLEYLIRRAKDGGMRAEIAAARRR